MTTKTNRRSSFGDYHHDDLLNRTEVASLLRVSKRTLEAWAKKGFGPPYANMGHGKNSPVVYRVGDLITFVASAMKRSSGDTDQVG